MSAETPLTEKEFHAPSLEEWARLVSERLTDGDLDALNRSTPDGISLAPLYTERDLAGALLYETPIANGPPIACTLVNSADPSRARESWREGSRSGGRGGFLRLDRVARQGLTLEGEGDLEALGAGGVAVVDAAELARVLEGAGAPDESIWLDAGANALPATALWLAASGERGVSPETVPFHCGADPLGALARDGVLPRDLMKLESEMSALARFSTRHLPAGRAVTVSVQTYQEAGATVVQELSFAVATTMSYLRAMGDSGLSPRDAAPEISWRFALGTDLFVETAKLRAAHRLWALVMAACGVDPAPEGLIHAVASERSVSRREPMNNALRATGQALIAASGGAGALTLLPFDAAGGDASVAGERLAVTTQAILFEEAHLARVTDPAAGSYFVESLTADLVRQGWHGAAEIEARGGMRECLVSERIARLIEASAAARAEAFESGEAAITGVTLFVDKEAAGASPRSPDPGSLLAEIEARRKERSSAEPTSAAVTYSRDFVIEELVAAARSGATLAELGRRLGGGEGAECCTRLSLRRDAAPFETFGDGEKR